jgi:hypothetical protein
MAKPEAYDMREHRLRYVAWTCARAIARGTVGAKVGNVYRTIISAELESALKKRFTSHRDYDKWHPKTVEAVIQAAKKNGMALTFGQGAKLLAIYIKTLYIIPGQRKDLLKHAHPPVDRILLMNALPKRERSNPGYLAWTHFDKKRYNDAFKKVEFKCCIGERWTIEKFWHPHQKNTV